MKSVSINVHPQLDYIDGYGTLKSDRSGEVARVFVQPPKNVRYRVEWLNLWQGINTGVSIMEQACWAKPLTQTEYRVRDWLLGMIGIDNWAVVNQAQIARDLRLHKVSVSKAISRLIEEQILIRGEKCGRQNQYRISPAFCFKGKLETGQTYARQAHNAKIFDFNKAQKEIKEIIVGDIVEEEEKPAVSTPDKQLIDGHEQLTLI